MDSVFRYFPDLTPRQREQFAALGPLYAEWNARINVVSRAVTDMATFTGWVWPLVERGRRGTLPNGILYLKGGDLTDELARTRQTWREYPISAFFDEEFFETKKVVYTSDAPADYDITIEGITQTGKIVCRRSTVTAD